MEVVGEEGLKLIDRDSKQATRGLSRLARHVPPDVEMGRILSAAADPDDPFTVAFLTSVGWWWANSASVDRLVEIGRDGSMVEVTSWCGGRETGRIVHRRGDA